MTAEREAPKGDPADALTRRGCLVLLVGGFLVVQVPRAVAGLVNGDDSKRWGAGLSLAFFAWLTWRSVLLFRDPRTAADPRFWTTSGVGYWIFAGLFAAYYVWLLATQDPETLELVGMVISMMLVLSLAMLTIWAGRKARARLAA